MFIVGKEMKGSDVSVYQQWFMWWSVVVISTYTLAQKDGRQPGVL